MRLAIVLVLGGIVALACGGGGNAASGSTPSSAASPSAAGGKVAEDLTFTGPLAGHMSSGVRGDTYICASTGASYVVGPIVGDVGGKQVSMNITKISFKGPGSYPAGGVGFDVGSDHYYPATGAAQSELVVNADLRSGTVNIDLAANSAPSTVVGHVSGTWRCPADQF
jgi:hypothetical protein